MKEILRRHSFSISLLVILVGSVFFFANRGGGIQRFSGYTMGTTYQIQIVDMPAGLSEQEVANQVSELLTQLDTTIFSTYAVNSELSRFNRHGVNIPFNASSQMIEVMQMSQQIADQTEGAFDITVGPLVDLWGFGPTLRPANSLPDQQQIDSLLESVGYQFLEIDVSLSQIRKTRDIFVDLSAIAKGYAVDQLANYFDNAGVENYFLEIGGELKIRGLKPGNVSWIPAIEAPVDAESSIYEIFFSRGEQIAVAGSGDYRNYFEVDGVRYSHEIDPRTGKPVSHNLAATYVIDESAAMADAWATAYMILGLEAARVLAEQNNQAAYFIYKDADAEFDQYVTAEFARYLSAD